MPEEKTLSFKNKEEYVRMKREIATYVSLVGTYKTIPSFGVMLIKPTIKEISDIYDIHTSFVAKMLQEIGFDIGT